MPEHKYPSPQPSTERMPIIPLEYFGERIGTGYATFPDWFRLRRKKEEAPYLPKPYSVPRWPEIELVKGIWSYLTDEKVRRFKKETTPQHLEIQKVESEEIILPTFNGIGGHADAALAAGMLSIFAGEKLKKSRQSRASNRI